MTDAPLTWETLDPREVAELRFLFTALCEKSGWEQYHLSACHGKHPFENRTQAISTIAYNRRHEIHAYHCPDCRKWHIGSMANSHRKQKADKRILNQRRER